jgi:predicted DNA-binding protein (MmcQ/YjbR family)
MTGSIHEDPRLVRLSEICARLPDSARDYNGQHAAFRVRKRTFAYYMDDHQGDGMVVVAFKAPEGMNEGLAESDPDRFVLTSYLWHKGWLSLRLDAGEIDWEEVADFVTDSYLMVAPKGLAAQVARSE